MKRRIKDNELEEKSEKCSEKWINGVTHWNTHSEGSGMRGVCARVCVCTLYVCVCYILGTQREDFPIKF